MSEAANLLAQLRAAIEHRKSEVVSTVDFAESHLRRLRPSVDQLEEFRVHVLSLETAAEEEEEE